MSGHSGPLFGKTNLIESKARTAFRSLEYVLALVGLSLPIAIYTVKMFGRLMLT